MSQAPQSEAKPKQGRGSANAGLRLAGTVLLILSSTITYLGGLWLVWFQLFAGVPTPLRIIVVAAAALAPIQLVADMISADRADRAERDTLNRGKDEILD